MSEKVILGYGDEGIYSLSHDGKLQKFELERDGEERTLRFSLISKQLRWLQGEVLTILEATIDDERKLKATKDLVKDKFAAKISWVYELCGMPVEDQEMNELVDPDHPVEVIKE